MAGAGDIRFDADAVKTLGVRAADRDYWRELIPCLTVEGRSAWEGVQATTLGEAALLSILGQVQEEGWFQVEDIFSAETVTRLRRGIEGLVQAGWPPVFAFLFDELWAMTRAGSVKKILSTLLGPGYRQRLYFWMHHVPARPGAHGWAPHTDDSRPDGLLPDGLPAMMSLWIPLSDATLDNGCMYVIPTSAHSTIGERFHDLASVTSSELEGILQSARALPARAGSLMGWHGKVVHWGSVANRRSPQPRISMAVEFQNAQRERDPQTPFLEAEAPLPTFWQRLLLIAVQIKTYLARYETDTRSVNMLALAELLVLWFNRGRGRSS